MAELRAEIETVHEWNCDCVFEGGPRDGVTVECRKLRDGLVVLASGEGAEPAPRPREGAGATRKRGT